MDPFPLVLEEKEDGELESDGGEEENLENESGSSIPHEEAIDEILASCHETPGDADLMISPNSLVSDGIIRREKNTSTPNAYRKRSNDASVDRSSRLEKSIRSDDNHRSGSSSGNRQKSHRKKEKQKRSRNKSEEKIFEKSSGVAEKSKDAIRDVNTIDKGLIEKNKKEKNITEKHEDLRKSSLPVASKSTELSIIEKRREILDENARNLEEKKSRLIKSERSAMIKKKYISDMCKRRDDYVARVKRLVQDIEDHMREECEMIKETDELRKEVGDEEVRWQTESNQLANDELMALLRIEAEAETVSSIEVDDIVNDTQEDEIEEENVEKEQEITESLNESHEDEDALRSMLLMQISKEKSAEAEVVLPVESNETAPPVKEADKDEMEQQDTEMEDEGVEDISVEEGDDVSSTMCPWDLNGICKDDECPYLHNRSSSRTEYSQEIS